MLNFILENFEIRDDGLVYRRNGKNSLEYNKPGKRGYIQVSNTINGKFKMIYLHRIKYALTFNILPKVVDHKDGNPLNNTIDNLRGCEMKQNQMNLKPPKKKSNLPKGVRRFKTKYKLKKPFYVQIRANGKNTYFGTFASEEEAFAVYCKIAKEIGYTDRHIFGDKEPEDKE